MPNSLTLASSGWYVCVGFCGDPPTVVQCMFEVERVKEHPLRPLISQPSQTTATSLSVFVANFSNSFIHLLCISHA